MIKNSTKADAEVIARATLYQTKKARIIILLSGIIVLAIGIALLCVDLIEQQKEGVFNIEWIDIFCLLMGFFFIVMGGAMSSKSAQIRNAQKIYRGEVKQYEFSFSEDGFELNYSESSLEGSEKGQYSAFLKIQEYADMYLLFLNSRQLYIMLKSGMTEGTTKELSALFCTKVYDRFKVCYKK